LPGHPLNKVCHAMTRRQRIAALAAIAALTVAACTNNDAKRSDVVDAMTDAGLSDDQAECVGDGIDEAFGNNQDVYNDLAAASDPEEFPEGTEETVRSVLDACVDGSGSGDETSETTEGSGTTETTEAEGGSSG
jgi:hypothetical protein